MNRSVKGWMVLLAGLIVSSSCGGDGVDPTKVNGAWCGRQTSSEATCTGDEVGYMSLTQSESGVTGQLCEAYQFDCSDIKDGVLSDGKLTFYYTFVEAESQEEERVDVELTLSEDGETLGGVFHSTKSFSDIHFTFHRI